ncbi:MAG: MFS transporter [Firmicutes bacterium]|nr:MFS transporter [Bacillota bacterium]
MSTSTQAGGFFPLFKKRAFIAMWLAQTISGFGDGVARIALLLLVTEKTSSPVALSVVAFAQAVPAIVLGPVAGVLIDRFDRKAVMAATDLLRAAVIAAAIWAPSLTYLYLLSFAMGALGAVFNPARSTVMPEMAGRDNYLAANGLAGMATQATMILGPAAGGLIAGLWGTGSAFLIDAATFLISSLSILLLPIPRPAQNTGHASFWRQLAGGASTVWREPRRRFVFGIYTPVILVMGSSGILLVDYLRNGLRVSPQQLGLVEAAPATGLILSVTLVGQFGRKSRPGRLILNSITGLGLVSSLFLFKPGYGVAVLLVWLLGAADGLSDVPINTLLLTLVPDEMRGRVFAAINALARFGGMVGLAVAGPLAALLGAHRVMGVAGVLALMIGVLGRKSSSYVELNQTTFEVSRE